MHAVRHFKLAYKAHYIAVSHNLKPELLTHALLLCNGPLFSPLSFRASTSKRERCREDERLPCARGLRPIHTVQYQTKLLYTVHKHGSQTVHGIATRALGECGCEGIITISSWLLLTSATTNCSVSNSKATPT